MIRPGERFNGYSHLAGLLAACVGAVALLSGASVQASGLKTAAALVFALSVLALYAASTLYHASRGRIKRFWRQADHCAIYGLIAGTCTPFILVKLPGPAGWALLSVIWLAAAAGIRRELRPKGASEPSLGLYIGMGWLCVLATVPLAARLESGALVWLLAGAALYSAGTVFYRNRAGLRHAHGVWHLFVLGGTASHYVAVAAFLL